jgi:hydroxypyruvate isomerase
VAVKQCLVLPIFYQPQRQTLDAFCAAIAEIGYAAIEIMQPGGDLAEIVATARRHGLAVASMVGHASLPDGLNKVANHDRIEAELRRAIETAAEHGIGGLICFSGNRNPGQSDYEGLVASAQGLRRVAPYAEKHGVNLNVELLNSRVDHPLYQADHTDWGVALCEMVGSARVRLLYDIYHMQIMEGDLIRSIRKNIAHIGHFHTAGNPRRQDLDDTQELNYTGICRAIDEAGYDLYVGHEFTPVGDRLEAARHAFRVCAGG